MTIEEFFLQAYSVVSAFLSEHPFITIVLTTIISYFLGGRKRKMKEEKKESGQVFSSLKPVYKLNKVTGSLEKTDEVIDVQEMIDSVIPMTLENILSKFLPKEDSADGELVEIADMQSDLDMLQETFAQAEELRVKYNIPDTVSTGDIYSYINEQLNKVKTTRKEVKPDEEKNVEPQGEQKELQKDRS